MIAQRFRPIYWVLGVALAILLLYGIQLQVANERGKLESVEEDIATVRKDIRRLQTEFKTRASMRQLERWNGDEPSLALSAPQARQYLASEEGISSLNDGRFEGDSYAPPPPMVMAAISGDSEEAAPADPETKPLTRHDLAVQKAIAGPKKEAPIKIVALAQPEAPARAAKKEGQAKP